ncbi:MAG TPA: hypothetical protein EYO20_07605 [Gemmatimonadetes bacterium]|nr:hypothetical protein [Gemmatimonadota bacterium]
MLDQTHGYGKLSPNGGRSVLQVLSMLILAVLVSQPLSAQAPGLETVSVRVAQQEPAMRLITVRSVLSYWGGASRVWDVFMVGFEGNVRELKGLLGYPLNATCDSSGLPS